MHLGLGAFHRAHQAVYLHRLRTLSAENPWNLIGGNIRGDAEDVISNLRAAGGRYISATFSPGGEQAFERIESIRGVIPWREDLRDLIAAGADSATQIISFTVTEAGYHLNRDHELETDPEVSRDIARLHAGVPGNTIYGALAAILATRMQLGGGPVTLLSCDNLRHNGERFRAAMLRFLALSGDFALLRWVTDHTSCPSSMVDRITPRPDEALRERVRSALGADDPNAVGSESYLQWVIEENFAAGRPPWESVGVQMVASVTPYEEAKIRILNGSHSCIAWSGALLGYTYIHEAVADSRIRRLVIDYVADVIPCLCAEGRRTPQELFEYRDLVLSRFSNAFIRDTVQRVATDSFSKFAGFIAPTIHDRLSVGADISGVGAVPILLAKFLGRWERNELPFEHHDQSMDCTAAIALARAPNPLASLCANVQLFGTLAANAALLAGIEAAADRVEKLIRN